MPNFKPGEIIKTTISKSGKSVTFRYPKWEDVRAMTDWVNKLSREDTYTRFSGEQMSVKDEAGYLGKLLSEIEVGDTVSVIAEIDGKFAGKCDVSRLTHMKQRSLHVGALAISLDSDFRGDGIGTVLIEATINEAKAKISGLKLITLDLFSNNQTALGLYTKVGFQECGRIPGKILHKGEYVDEIWMYLNV